MISQIAAASSNNVIGNSGDIPWNLPEDMQFFKNTTKGHAIIMGRVTFESLGKALPKRLNVVVTRRKDYSPEGAFVFSNIEDAIAFCQTKTEEFGEEIFIIGGGEIYRQTLDVSDRLYLTRVHGEYEGDAFYPEIDASKFKEVSKTEGESQDPKCSFIVYDKI